MQRLKTFIGDLSTAQGKLKLTIIVAAVLLVIGAGGIGALNATNAPQFCASCHEMQPEYATWEVSSHAAAGVGCIECHVEPGFTNFVKHKAASLKQVYEHVTQTYPSPITMPHPIETYVCEQCHEPEGIQPAGELIIPHEQHLESNVECVSCHSGVAHANIASRELTADGDWDAWTVEKAEAELVRNNILPSMDTCMGCHEQRQVDNSCATCHTEKGKPENHEAAAWSTNHGVIVKDISIKECSQCHGEAKTAINAVEYSRESEYCTSCHQQRPESHQDGQWMLNHKQTVADKETGLENCFTCHDRKKVENSNSPSTVNCNTCHPL